MKAIGATLERCDNIAHDVKSQIAPAALSLLLHFTLTCKKQMELCRLEVMAAHRCSRNSSNCTFPTRFLFCIFYCMFLEKRQNHSMMFLTSYIILMSHQPNCTTSLANPAGFDSSLSLSPSTCPLCWPTISTLLR